MIDYKLQNTSSNGTVNRELLEEVLKDRISSKSKRSPVIPVIKIQGRNFATIGDISFISGLPKAGKTTISICILATACMKVVPENLDTLDIRTTYAGNKPVIFIDTEQNPSDTERLEETIRSVIGVEETPDNLHCMNLRKYKRKDKWERVKMILEAFPNPHIVVVDGLADLLADPNNTDSSFDLIDEFMVLSEELKTSFILYLHLNPGSNKMRGNLGSEGERKARGVLTVAKDKNKGIHTIQCVFIRGDADFEEIHAKFSTQAGRLLKCSSNEAQDYKKVTDKKEIRKELLKKLAYQCLVGGSEHVRFEEFANRYTNYSLSILGKQITSRTTISKGIDEMIEYKIIAKDETGKYYWLKAEKC